MIIDLYRMLAILKNLGYKAIEVELSPELFQKLQEEMGCMGREFKEYTVKVMGVPVTCNARVKGFRIETE